MVSHEAYSAPQSSTISSGIPAESVSRFPYKPLDSSVDTIRLIVLHPRRKGEKGNIVRCSLIHSDFLSKPKYEAISYTWGSPTSLQTIHINGVRIPVRENLFSALYFLRLDEDRILWADAICIDQSNLEERRFQVGLMAFIYSRAHCVLVWLGEPELPEAEELLARSNGYESSLREPVFRSLFKHEYWSRLWVIQEVGLAMHLKICLGGACRDWDHLLRAARTNGMGETESFMFNIDAKRRGRHGDTNRLEILLEDFQYAKCEDPRDKIYGFLGLAHDCQDGSLEADYTKSLFDLYVDVIRFFCRRRMLRDGSTNDLDRSMRVMRFSQLLQKLLGVARNMPANLSTTTDIVQVRGAIGGHVLHLGPTYREILSSYNANKKWTLSFGSHYSLPQDIQRLREANESYGALLLQMTDEDLKKIRRIEPRIMYSKARRVKGPWKSNESYWSHQELENEVGRGLADTPATTNSVITSDQPRMFLGNNHLLGLVPQEAKEGDVICQFWNCDVVALLRLEETTGFYRVVGRVYLSTGSLKDFKPVYVKWNDPIEDAEVMHIQMDINTLSVLSCLGS